jgi:hypothetical protein
MGIVDELKPKKFKCRQSCIICAAGCHRKLLYQYLWGITLRGGEYKEGAFLGDIYHKLQRYGPERVEEVRAWLRKKQQKIMDQVQKGEDLDGNLTRMANVMTSLFDKALVMSKVFWIKYPQPDFLKTVAVEQKHEVIWNGMILSGTLDKIMLNMRLRSRQKLPDVWVRDHKSTGHKTLDPIFGGASWSIQGRVYRILARDWCKKNEKEIGRVGKIKGFILDGILKPGIKCCKTDQKNADAWKVSLEDAYLRRIVEWYEKYEEEKETKSILSQSVIFNEPISNPELVEHLGMMKDLVSRPLKPKNFSRDVTRYACFMYEKQCIYHDLCATPPSHWGELFERKYKQELKEDDD